MSQTFTCPKCGAPQTYTGGTAATIVCPYCHTTLIVPPELRTEQPDFQSFGTADWTKQANALMQIKQLVQRGDEIGAIKLYRGTFGTGLQESKLAVEAIGRGTNVQVAQVSGMTPGHYEINTGAGTVDITTGADGVKINAPDYAGGVVGGKTWNGCNRIFIIGIVAVVLLSIAVPLIAAAGSIWAAFGLFNTAAPTIVSLGVEPHSTRVPTQTRVQTPTVMPTPGFASLIQTFGSKGTAPGQLNDARTIAVDTKGNVYVGDYLTSRIQRFDTKGNFQDQWTVAPKADLTGLATDFHGNLYAVADGVIYKYDGTTGKKLGTLTYDVPGDGFDDVALTPDGGLDATWYQSRNGLITSLEGHRDDLVQFDRDGKAQGVIQGIVSGQTDDLQLDNHLAVDNQGNIYVLAQENNEAVYKFSPAGKYINRFGSPGNDAGQWNTGWSIATDSKGRVYVGATDSILVFTPDGRYINSIANVPTTTDGMTFDAQDHLWVVTRDNVKEFQLNQ